MVKARKTDRRVGKYRKHSRNQGKLPTVDGIPCLHGKRPIKRKDEEREEVGGRVCAHCGEPWKGGRRQCQCAFQGMAVWVQVTFKVTRYDKEFTVQCEHPAPTFKEARTIYNKELEIALPGESVELEAYAGPRLLRLCRKIRG